ncbi:MAG TPA: OsmC family protein [Chryseosolibacter sp.]|nr:OsmC family protein [Chryseosolibacter sp.]
MITIELNRLNDAFHFSAENESGNTVQLDGSPDIGGQNKGMRPMQMLLAAMGGCSAIDVINILKKQRQDLKDLKITVKGEREKDATPSLYQTVHAHYKFFGQLDPDKVEKAINLSIDKYCSVSKTLEKAGTTITHSFEIIPA